MQLILNIRCDDTIEIWSKCMKIIMSPAKKMHVDTDSLPFKTLPQFLPEAQEIKFALQHMSTAELQALWRCNDAIAALNVQRLRGMGLN